MISNAHTRRGVLSAIAFAPAIIAAPAVAMTAPSQIEVLRLEYRAVFNALNASPEWDDDCPIVSAQVERMKALESLIVATPSKGAADLMTDIAKHLL